MIEYNNSTKELRGDDLADGSVKIDIKVDDKDAKKKA